MYRVLHFFFYCAVAVAIPSELHNRIVGGKRTFIERHPYQVSFETLGGHQHFCGGTIISPNFIVTAAHCRINAGNTAVRIETTQVGQGGILHRIKTVTTHPDFNFPTEFDNDIAIVELQNPIDFSGVGQPIGLPKKSEKIPAGTPVSVSGWGQLRDNGKSPVHLQVVHLPILDHEKCVQNFARAAKKRVTRSMICAGYFEDRGKDACLYDSGGPLVSNGKLYGIVSWGIGCATPGFPGVYSDVAYLRDFITQVTGL